MMNLANEWVPKMYLIALTVLGLYTIWMGFAATFVRNWFGY